MIDHKYTVKSAIKEYFCGTVKETALREAIRRGDIPYVKLGGKYILSESSLDGWWSQQEYKIRADGGQASGRTRR